jgi:ParB family chromosome partitioning protein
MGHAKAIAALDHDLQIKALKKCVKKALSVRQAEMLARKLAETPVVATAEDEEEYPESYSRLVVELERVLSDNISIKRTKSGSTRIVVECANDNEVELLVAKLCNIK